MGGFASVVRHDWPLGVIAARWLRYIRISARSATIQGIGGARAALVHQHDVPVAMDSFEYGATPV